MTIFLTETLGALRRPSAVILMKPVAYAFAGVRVRFGYARPLNCANSEADCGFLSRIVARSARFYGVSSRTTASVEWKLGFAASSGAARSPRTALRISRSREARL